MSYLETYFREYCPLASEDSKDAARNLYKILVTRPDVLGFRELPSTVDRYQAALIACKASHVAKLNEAAADRFENDQRKNMQNQTRKIWYMSRPNKTASEVRSYMVQDHEGGPRHLVRVIPNTNDVDQKIITCDCGRILCEHVAAVDEVDARRFLLNEKEGQK